MSSYPSARPCRNDHEICLELGKCCVQIINLRLSNFNATFSPLWVLINTALIAKTAFNTSNSGLGRLEEFEHVIAGGGQEASLSTVIEMEVVWSRCSVSI